MIGNLCHPVGVRLLPVANAVPNGDMSTPVGGGFSPEWQTNIIVGSVGSDLEYPHVSVSGASVAQQTVPSAGYTSATLSFSYLNRQHATSLRYEYGRVSIYRVNAVGGLTLIQQLELGQASSWTLASAASISLTGAAQVQVRIWSAGISDGIPTEPWADGFRVRSITLALTP